MYLHRVYADEHLLGYLLVRCAAHYEVHKLALAVGQAHLLHRRLRYVHVCLVVLVGNDVDAGGHLAVVYSGAVARAEPHIALIRQMRGVRKSLTGVGDGLDIEEAALYADRLARTEVEHVIREVPVQFIEIKCVVELRVGVAQLL